MENFPDNLIPLETEYNGVPIFGKFIRRVQRDLVVEILAPYNGFYTGLHIPYFANPKHSYLEELGEKDAKMCLKRLFCDLKVFYERLDLIEASYPYYVSTREKNDAFLSLLKEQKKDLKRKLREGSISEKQYSQQLILLRKEIKMFEWENIVILENFLTEQLGFSPDVMLRKQLEDFLKNKLEDHL